MDKFSKEFRFLITTDFNLSALSKFRFNHSVSYGGWIVDRVPYEPEKMVKDINKLGINILIVEVEEVSAYVFENCPELVAVITMRANPVNIDLDAAKKHRINVIHAPGRNAQSVTELTICLMLDVLRKVSFSYWDMCRGNWGEGKQDPYLRFRGNELQGKKVGLIGFGAIGQSVAKLLEGFLVDVLAYDPYQTEEVFSKFNAAPVQLDFLLRQADIISIHTPLNKETINLLGEREFLLMKPEAIIINTARAAVINKEAFVKALQEGLIAGAALDVHYNEPPLPDDPLYSLQNLLFTPHIGGATREVITRGSEIVIEELASCLEGEKAKLGNSIT